VAISRKLKKRAGDFLSLGYKIYHFRKDVMSETRARTLGEKLREFRTALASRDSDDALIQSKMDTLDPLLKKVGGNIYPRNFWNDNVDMLLVAAIVVIGIRTFIAQPFIIPTNSMYPSYAGITYKLYQTEHASRNPIQKVWSLVTKGARHRSAVAPVSGEVFIPIFERRNQVPPNGNGSLLYKEVQGRAFGVWPTRMRQYRLYVGTQGDYATLKVPSGFRLDEVISDLIQSEERAGFPQRVAIQGRAFLRTGIRAQAGEPILSFDIQLGDMLFVERMSYHFRKPDIGDPFVFRTGRIPGLVDSRGNPEDKYYIKRLVGKPGDTLRIEPPVLFRNEKPISGSRAFQKNHARDGDFEGYTTANPGNYSMRRGVPVPEGSMQDNQPVHIPEGHYYAMGDNSDESLDSRTWGFVPEKEIVGRAFFIYYPFTNRWGLAH